MSSRLSYSSTRKIEITKFFIDSLIDVSHKILTPVLFSSTSEFFPFSLRLRHNLNNMAETCDGRKYRMKEEYFNTLIII